MHQTFVYSTNPLSRFVSNRNIMYCIARSGNTDPPFFVQYGVQLMTFKIRSILNHTSEALMFHMINDIWYLVSAFLRFFFVSDCMG